jgi:hypothetical protein
MRPVGSRHPGRCHGLLAEEHLAMTTLLVGDVAGHLAALDEVLEPFGVSVSDSYVPDGTVVVQVGDLIGRSTESAQLIASVDQLRDRTPDRWIQLAGNHELHHLGGLQFEGTCELPPSAVNTMRGWLADGWLRFAIAVTSTIGVALVTHAGLTRTLWSELGSPADAEEAGLALEGLRTSKEGWELLNRSGRMLNLGRFPLDNPAAGPIWAEAAFELLPGWVANGDMPFDQVHGHSSLYDWFRARYRNEELRAHAAVDRDERHVRVSVGPDRKIIGIDPGLGKDGHARWAPLVM